MIFEGDFVAGVINDDDEADHGLQRLLVPADRRVGAAVVGGGDVVMMFKDSPAARAFVTYLATPEAARSGRSGRLLSPNKNVDPSAYTDPLTRATATALAEREVFRFDLSDLQPAAFGGTVGQGEFKIFQDFEQYDG